MQNRTLSAWLMMTRLMCALYFEVIEVELIFFGLAICACHGGGGGGGGGAS